MSYARCPSWSFGRYFRGFGRLTRRGNRHAILARLEPWIAGPTRRVVLADDPPPFPTLGDRVDGRHTPSQSRRLPMEETYSYLIVVVAAESVAIP